MHREYVKGIKDAVPIALGYLPIGFAFGILAVQQGMAVSEIFIMSLIVYAGSAQFIGAAMLASGAAPLSIVSTTLLVNLRHLLMSASLSPYLKHFSSKAQSLIAIGITDETFTVSSNHVRREMVSPKYFAGLHITSQSSWIASTVLGGLLGSLIPDPGRYGINFALSAMFIGLLVVMTKHKKDVLVALCAGGISLVLAMGMDGNWNVILAAILAATIGVVVERWTQKQS